jgi:uncharacterized DUF497 family protein
MQYMVAIKRLIWDEWNITHIARHGVTPAEVEIVCQGDFILLKGKKGRLVVIGFNQVERMLAVVLDPEPEGTGVYYPVTARPASRKERRLYQQAKKGEIK